MITREPIDCFGYTIFCDDIREEVSGKTSFVGAYGARLFVHGSFPVTLPKFAMSIAYYQKTDSVNLPLRIVVFVPGDPSDKPSIEFEQSAEDASGAIQEAQESRKKIPGAEGGIMVTHANLVFAPFVINEAGVIRVRAVRGDELIRLGSLGVYLHPAAATQTPTPKL
jgi:hypothetical protein